MSEYPDGRSVEAEAAKIYQPIDELLAKEANELEKLGATISEQEMKVNKLFPPAKRMDEE